MNIDLIILFIVFVFFLDLAIFIVAYAYSRFVFNEYLKKHHRIVWDKLVHGEGYTGLSLTTLDKTKQLEEFRVKSKEDLGDPKIPRMRFVSVFLLRAAFFLWLGLAGLIVCFGVVHIIMKR